MNKVTNNQIQIIKNRFKISIPLAIILTLLSVFYQRMTGPTYPKIFKIQMEDGQEEIKLLRSHSSSSDALIKIPLGQQQGEGTLSYRRYPTNDEWTTTDLKLENNFLVGILPKQPPAGKHQYFVSINLNGKSHQLGSRQEPITIRFKGNVPSFILIPHILFMFLSMLIGLMASIEAMFKTQSYSKLTISTAILILVGGMVLGPIVQKYAFGVFWAGFPFGVDLTDNKLLIAAVVWIVAAGLNWKKAYRWPVIIAMSVQLATYLIPHSTMGSQYNYESGQVETLKKLKGP